VVIKDFLRQAHVFFDAGINKNEVGRNGQADEGKNAKNKG